MSVTVLALLFRNSVHAMALWMAFSFFPVITSLSKFFFWGVALPPPSFPPLLSLPAVWWPAQQHRLHAPHVEQHGLYERAVRSPDAGLWSPEQGRPAVCVQRPVVGDHPAGEDSGSSPPVPSRIFSSSFQPRGSVFLSFPCSFSSLPARTTLVLQQRKALTLHSVRS